MFSHDLNFSPKVVGKPNWSLSEELKKPHSAQSAATALLQDIRSRHGVAETPITEELVIKTLRSAEKPETIYWLLRSFVESNAQNQLINTDKGRTLYIELDRLEETVSVYIGATDSVVCLGDDERQLYAMDVQERYDYVWYAFLGVALKRKLSAQAIQDLASRDDETTPASAPTLFYTCGNESVCVMRTNWYQCMSKLPLPDLRKTTSYCEYKSARAADEEAGNVLARANARGPKA